MWSLPKCQVRYKELFLGVHVDAMQVIITCSIVIRSTDSTTQLTTWPNIDDIIIHT